MLFPERNKKSSYKMNNFFSCYVLILSIHMNPKNEASILKYFRSKGEHLSSNEKRKKGKTFFSVKFEIIKVFGKLQFFLLHKKERKEKIALVNCFLSLSLFLILSMFLFRSVLQYFALLVLYDGFIFVRFQSLKTKI